MAFQLNNIVKITTLYKAIGLEKFSREARKVNEAITRKQRAMQDATKMGRRYRETIENNRIAQKGFFDVMRMDSETFGKYIRQNRKFETIGGRIAGTLRRITHGARGFRMEMLGIMFFGMTLNRTLMGLIKTSMDWTGVTEIFTQTLGILFLPVAELLLDWSLYFLKAVTNLTDKQKKWIGMLVLGGAILGGFIMVVGTLALGIGSLIMAFGALATPMMLFFGLIAGISGYFLFNAWLKNSAENVDKLREKMVNFGVSGEMFDLVKEKLIGFANIIRDKFIDIKSKIGEFIGEVLPKMIESGGDIIMSLVNGIAANANKISEAIKKLINKIISWIDENLDLIIDSGLKILQAIVDGISENVDKIGSALQKLLERMGTWVGENSDKIINIGLTIAGYIIEGVIKGLGNLGEIVGEKIRNVINTQLGIEEGSRLESFMWGPKIEKPEVIKNPLPGTVISTPYGGMSIATTYNVNVSDKRDFIRLLEENNRQLVFDVQRSVRT